MVDHGPSKRSGTRQIGVRTPLELLAWIDEFGRSQGWDRTETVLWCLGTLQRALKVLGERAEQLLRDERESGLSVGYALAVKALDTLLREETRPKPETLKHPHRR